MPRYCVFGLQLESDIEFPELPAWVEGESPGAGTDSGPATFKLGMSSPPPPVPWVHSLPREDGAPWLSVGPPGPRRLLQFHGVAGFLLTGNRLDVEALPEPGATLEAVRWLFLDHVLPRALASSGRPVLHASAVETDRGALVFVGESGSGKSTLAASFSDSGARLLSDDGVLLAGSRVVPSYPVHRLWTARAGVTADTKKKNRCAPAAWKSSTAPLRRIFILAPHIPGQPWISREPGGEAMLALVRQSFRLDPTDQALAAAEFRVLGDLASAFPPLRLAHPRRVEIPGRSAKKNI